MKVIILAAGKGSRLGQGHANVPKSLSLLASGKSIFEHQLESLQRYISLDKVIVVVGYQKEAIINRFPDLLYVYNPAYASENTSKSLLRALKKCNEDVLWLNGDVVFHPSVIEKILDSPRTSMVVNRGAVGEEEVKYRQNAEGKILAVSKRIEDPQGEALGINYCEAADLELFKKNLERCQPTDYFEKGLELCIEQGMNVWSVLIERHLCTEVDFQEDLENANHLIRSWNE
jgi:L-glutamine-phosphate cytidylyltransferase